jgi:hypothetical protein
MSSTYIPPYMRNRKTNSVPEKKLPTSDDFPSLSSAPVRTNAWSSTRSFAVLASEWKEHDEEEQMKKEAKEFRTRYESDIRRRDEQNVFVFKNDRGEYAENYSVQEDAEFVDTDTSDWKTIEKKAKRELTIEEKIERQIAQEAEEKAAADRDSVWNDGTGDDWDYRDRRSYS